MFSAQPAPSNGASTKAADTAAEEAAGDAGAGSFLAGGLEAALSETSGLLRFIEQQAERYFGSQLSEQLISAPTKKAFSQV